MSPVVVKTLSLRTEVSETDRNALPKVENSGIFLWVHHLRAGEIKSAFSHGRYFIIGCVYVNTSAGY